MKRPVFDVFDCSFIPDCFLLPFSLFLCCSIRRSPADFLKRPAKRSGCTVTNSRATSSRAGCPRRKTPTPFALSCRKRSRISLSLSRLNRSCFPLVAMLQNRLGTRTKTSQTRVFFFFVFSQSIYHCTRLWTFRKWSTEFRLDSVSIDRLSDRFGINFRNSHPDLNIPSKKFRRTECKTSLLNARKSTVYIDRARGRRLRATESRTQKSSNSLIRFRCSNSCFLLETCIAGQERLLLAKWHPKPRKKRRNGGFSTPLTCMKSCTVDRGCTPAPKDATKLAVFFRFFRVFPLTFQ